MATNNAVKSTVPVTAGPAARYAEDIIDVREIQKHSHVKIVAEDMNADGLKQVIDEGTFARICLSAEHDALSAARSLSVYAAKAGPTAYVEFAKACFSGPYGRIGARRSLRSTGVMLLDECIKKFPNHCPALCAKGQAILPPKLLGKADPNSPGEVMTEAYLLFCKAASLGSIEGRFLRARWLISTASAHRSEARMAEGKAELKAAVVANLPQALVFLAQCYEYPLRFSPVSFQEDVPASRREKQKLILSLYMRAAKMNHPDGLNDVGSSYAMSYAGLKPDFDTTARYYVKAIQVGSLHAFDNMGKLYETGMSGRFEERIDLEKALHYYSYGTKMRCPYCALSLAQAYLEGMHMVLLRDCEKAENYYRLAIKLADDDNDDGMVCRVLKKLGSLYMTRIKLSDPGSESVKRATRRLEWYIGHQMFVDSIDAVNKAVVKIVRGELKALVSILGDKNARHIKKRVDELMDRLARVDGEPSESMIVLVEHVFGSSVSIDRLLKMKRSKGKRRRFV